MLKHAESNLKPISCGASEHPPGSPETDCHWSLDGSRPITAACADSEAEHGPWRSKNQRMTGEFLGKK